MPVSEKLIDSYVMVLPDKEDASSTIKKNAYYVHDALRWSISYKFNPPDDADPNDIVHRIITTKDYTDLLHPGDLLPILYLIDPNDSSHVMSMPYPMPSDEIWDHHYHYAESSSTDPIPAPLPPHHAY